jgi:hypothetical protein
MTLFPLKTSSCAINRDSTLMYSRSPGNFIIYNELFDMGSVKLNMTNKLTEQILKDPNLKHLFDKRVRRNNRNESKGMNSRSAVDKMRELSRKGKKGKKGKKVKVTIKKKRIKKK